MEGGIIAAGLGSRFKEAGIGTPKPLLKVGGRPLIAWTLAQFQDAGINRIHIIFRSAICDECISFVRREFPGISFRFICRDTGSSAESFLTLLGSWKAGRRILVTTVDSIYSRGMLKRFRDAAEAGPENALYLGVTTYIEDEKPLYADVDRDGRVLSLGESRKDFVTSGAYLLQAGLAEDRNPRGYKALRALLKELASLPEIAVHGVDLGKVLDVDRPEDLMSAERFIRNNL